MEVDEAHIDSVRQKMGMVFQHFNLFPHLTVKKNLELAPSPVSYTHLDVYKRQQLNSPPPEELPLPTVRMETPE